MKTFLGLISALYIGMANLRRLGKETIRYLAVLLLATSIAAAYIASPDEVLIDGRILLTSSRPLDAFPWKGEPPHLSEHPYEGVSDRRQLKAVWEIKDGRLYLLAVSAFRFDGFAPRRSMGLRDLMPEHIKEGRVLAEWFTGDFDVIELERVDRRLFLRPEDAPQIHTVVRKFRVVSGKVTEEPDRPAQPKAGIRPTAGDSSASETSILARPAWLICLGIGGRKHV